MKKIDMEKMLNQMFDYNTGICMMIDNNYRISDIFEKYKGDIKIMYYLASSGYYLKELVEYDESWIHEYINHKIYDPKLPNSIVGYEVLVQVVRHIDPSYFNLITSSKYYKYTDVRVELAKRCDDILLEVLMEDESAYVRAEVARRGYSIDVLVHDNEQIVRNAAVEYFIDNYYNKKVMVNKNEEKK